MCQKQQGLPDKNLYFTAFFYQISNKIVKTFGY